VFSTRLITPTASFAEAVKGNRNNPPQQDGSTRLSQQLEEERRRQKNLTRKRRWSYHARQQVTIYILCGKYV
jgi:hypothetical protein